MRQANLVEVAQLTKRFSKTNAVNHISFSIKKGEIVGLLGPNGAGKTTIIHMLLGLITPTSGSIEIFGKNLSTHQSEILQSMNFSSTYTHLPLRLTVWENLYVVALLYSVADAAKKVDDVIHIFSMDQYKDTAVNDLSSGWVTRLNLARTFLNDPQFILLDEPTASLDPESADEVRKQILTKQKKDGMTILWTSHNMAEVEKVCDRVIFLHKGKIIAQDTPEGLARRIHISRVRFLIEEKGSIDKLTKSYNWSIRHEGRFVIVELAEKEIPQLLALLTSNNIVYNEISIDQPTLEDFFLSTVKE